MNCPPVATYLIGNTCSMTEHRRAEWELLPDWLHWDALPTWAQWILAPAMLVFSMASFYLLVLFGVGIMHTVGELPGHIVKAIKENYKKNKETPK